jgi:hypothetical protein
LCVWLGPATMHAMNSLHPSLLAALARERVRTTRPVPRRRRLGELGPEPVWGGGRTVRPRAGGRR